MKIFELCADPANPRRTCRGIDCRCKGLFRFQRSTDWSPPRRGEAMYYCHGCGIMHVVIEQRVDYWTACWHCRREFRVKGTSFIATWLWHLFGRHEGYNDWSMWRAWI